MADGDTQSAGGSDTDSKKNEEISNAVADEITKENFDPEKFRQLKKELNERAEKGTKAQQEENERLRKQLQEYEDAKLSEQQRLEKERDEERAKREAAESQLRKRDIRDGLAETADSIGFRNPKLAYKLIDEDKLKIDDSGTITNAKELLEAIANDEPYLLRGGAKSNASDTGGGNSPQDMNALIRERASR